MLGLVHRGRWVLVATAAVLVSACSGNAGTSPLAAPARTIGAAGPSSGCGSTTPALGAGEEKVTITSNAVERWYFRHVPPAHDGTKPLPLVLDLHGYLEGAVAHQVHSSLGAFGDQQGFVTITPQGLGTVPRWETSVESKDVAFIGDLLDQVEQTACIDRARVFVTGLSNGAMMTSVIACALAGRVAAVAPVAGVADVKRCKPARPVPVVAFHGTTDPFVAYDGGLGPAVANLPAPDGSGRTLGEVGVRDGPKGPSVPEVMQAWAQRNHCEGKPIETKIAADVTKLTFACPAGADVELYRVDGGGHSWPGSAFSKQIKNVVGPTTDSISANEVMWNFFRTHPLTGIEP